MLGWLALAVAGALLCRPLSAELPRFERISMADGLSQSSIEAMLQCDDGFHWFGTQFGLDRWDGYRFRSWRHDPNDENSLSHSAVSDLWQSRFGGLWVATRAGLDRLDPLSGRVQRFSISPALNDGDPWQGALRILAETAAGDLYLESGDGLWLWRRSSERIEAVAFAQPVPAEGFSRRSAVLDREGRLWLANAAGLWRADETGVLMERLRPFEQEPELPLYRAVTLTRTGLLGVVSDHRMKLIDPQSTGLVASLHRDQLGLGDIRFNAVFAADDGSLWLAMSIGLVQYFPETGQAEIRFSGSRVRRDADTRQRVEMAAHPNGDLWFSSQYGLAQWQAASQQVRFHRHRPGDPSSIPPSTLGAGYGVMIDRQQTVWVGSRLGGLARLPNDLALFAHIEDQDPDATSAFSGLNIVRGVVEQVIDGQTDLWLALDHGGIRRLRLNGDGRFERIAEYHNLAELPYRLPGNVVWRLAADPLSDRIWAVEHDHLVVLDARSGQIERVIRLVETPDDPELTALTFAEDGQSLWVGTVSGVHGFALADDRLELEPLGQGLWLPGLRVFNFLPQTGRKVLVAGRDAIALIEPDRSQPGFRARQYPLPMRTEVYGLAAHPEQGWWLGTRESGLLHAWSNGQGELEFRAFTTADGLADNTVYAVLPEPDGRLWLSSNRGLMRWNPATRQGRQFMPRDGIQAFEFNHAVAHQGSSGRFYFGGINGVNAFWPNAVVEHRERPSLLLDVLNIAGERQPLPARRAGKLVVDRSTPFIELGMLALNYNNPDRVRYAWRLRGQDDDWVEAGQQRMVRLSGLAPGPYVFEARVANGAGLWSEPVVLLNLEVEPAWWQSQSLLVLACGLVLLALIGWARRSRQQRRSLEDQIAARTAELTRQQALIKRQARELEEALENRTVFFASVSHEFRTPLTLIEGSLERLAAAGGDPVVVERGRRYVRRLLRLVEQLLDLSRLRVRHDETETEPWALAPVLEFTIEAFRSLADQRGIALEADIEPDWVTRCGQEHVEKIFLNLLTNALKFTPEGGRVGVRLTGSPGNGRVCLEVNDTGPGIPSAEQAIIFERFRRAEAADRAGLVGAGIGLALVREAAVALGGHIELISQPGQGSRFRVFLPARQGQAVMAPASLVSPVTALVEGESLLAAPRVDPSAEIELGAISDGARLGTVLVVEDNPDLRAHLCELLSASWRTVQAADGHQALERAISKRPDVIVSDIMMPGMDGLAMLARLRDNLETSHIPVMLLTARSDVETRLKGLSLSADDFMAKPFQPRELLLRLRRMVENRERLRRRLASAGLAAASTAPVARPEPDTPVPDSAELSSRDRALIERIDQWLDQAAHDSSLKVDDMASVVALERRTLQRKLKVLTGLTPAAYLRRYRFRKAAHLLTTTDQSVTEVALSSGFASPQHFSRVFRQEFGMPPDQWRQQKR
ncbi:MAG: hybrid sensor histidine kinase/response regulator transcription factor [Wenzhouxiangella sp.]